MISLSNLECTLFELLRALYLRARLLHTSSCKLDRDTHFDLVGLVSYQSLISDKFSFVLVAGV